MAIVGKVGDRYRSFVLKKLVPIQELQMTLYELQHEPSGATVLHLEYDDQENLFSLSFRTLPTTSNGVAHILEHTVLCGSKKFPIKDPFFGMQRRSLHTFMNALTGQDFTCYPAASQIEKDFYNLFDVYVDAVFHPQLKKMSFLQEGWRLEFAEPKDPTSNLIYKGIVFNEMKGAMSSADSRLGQKLMSALLPDLTYGINSGGDPKEIPNLSYEELIAFHDTFYHPGNCLFFFYGNIPLQKHLDYLEEKVLKNVSKPPAIPSIPKQKRYTQPKEFSGVYPSTEEEEGEEETKAICAFGWLTCSVEEQEEVLAMSLLDSVLMDTDASPLKAALLQSGLCSQADSMLDTEMSEVPFAIVCKGCADGAKEKLQALITSTLERLVKEQIPQELIESSLHQLEFSRSEIASGSNPYGLVLFMRAALAKQHNCPPENSLMIHSLFDSLRKKLQDHSYLPSFIEKYLLRNTHRIALVMNPSPSLTEEENQDEAKRLSAIKAALSTQEKEAIIRQNDELKKYQKEMERQNIDCLPQVTLADVPRDVKDFPLEHEQLQNGTLYHHSCFTNQILYADLTFDLPALSEEELPYLHLFTSLFSELGAHGRSYEENLHQIQLYTGGIDAHTALHTQASNPERIKPVFQLHGKALMRNSKELFRLMKEMVLSVRLDEAKRIEELILQLQTSLQQSLSQNALRYAMQLSGSGFSASAHIHNLWHGLPFYSLVDDLKRNIKRGIPQLIEKLLAIKEKVLSFSNPALIVSCDEKMFQELKSNRFYDLLALPQKGAASWVNQISLKPVPSQGKLISSPVAFTSQTYKTVPYIHPHAPALYLATQLFENKILHRTIREEGGAYGGGAHFNPSFGNFSFYSYRDPHLSSTLKAFQTAIEMIGQGEFDEVDLVEAKLGMVQTLDSPVAPGSRASVSYSRLQEGKTKEVRQAFRNRLLDATKDQVRLAVEQELLSNRTEAVTVSFAAKEFFKNEEPLLQKDQKTFSITSI